MTRIRSFSTAMALAIFSYHTAAAQAFNIGQQSFSAGYGLGTLNGAVIQFLSGYGIQSQSLYGPYYAKYEKGITNHLGFGINASLMRNDWLLNAGANVPGSVNEMLGGAQAEVQRWSYSAVARLNYHFAKNKNSKLDPYFGAGLGYRSANWSVQGNDEFNALTRVIPNTPLAFEFTLGARYYILPNVGVYAEFGGSKSLLQGGLIMDMPSGKPKANSGSGGKGGKGDSGNKPAGGTSSGGGGKIGKK